MKIERKNAYFCAKCRKVTITVDVDKGVTPMMIICPYCNKEVAVSFMYNLPGCIYMQKADYEWYKSDEDEQLSKRKRTDKKPIYHDTIEG